MEKQEIWKAIPHYEGIYEASNFGRIRTCEGKITQTQHHGIRHWKQRILKPKGETYATGYKVTLWKDGKSKDWLVARLVAMTFLGESNLTVNHIDGNRFNNCIENLEWCSLADNIKKGFELGLYKNQKNVLLICNDSFLVPEEIKKMFTLFTAYGRSFSPLKEPTALFYFAKKLKKRKLYQHEIIDLPEAIEVFSYTQKNYPELFKLFYENSSTELRGGELQLVR